MSAVWAIVLAGGASRRFGERAKQFEHVGGVPMVARTVAAARRTCDGVVLVLPPGRAWTGEPVDAVAEGGDHQSESLRSGLAAVPADAAIVAVADPAHPLASDALFDAVVEAVRGGADGAVPVIPVLEVVQRVRDGQVVETLPKDELVLTQTPQAFRADVLRAVHADRPRPVENSGLLVERGHRVVTVSGDVGNVHVTTPQELAIAERLVLHEICSPSPACTTTSDRAAGLADHTE
ncbi:2-C-methyl-D-erythritol 4-phosphate cytidylyltransferase [Pseudonocardia hierapolitana]|uniref:2-C-methyl-D-erythritol 4-phosphate cytidylyltransferase n=1 Tax=Pseudonocardia hierapolitana TaxID=1128676 RepID=A0A561SRY5_9PSEU|nr:2-C-methyl-D-erythritol 4-phosphate cytidylyltransferase [Pseudonocardia hierapolitana]TWF77637.1 2-C-methyl-D-erythritol 4-phosphate cytidylyltransferase [Pseudonocardia hierapolitana]